MPRLGPCTPTLGGGVPGPRGHDPCLSPHPLPSPPAAQDYWCGSSPRPSSQAPSQVGDCSQPLARPVPWASSLPCDTWTLLSPFQIEFLCLGLFLSPTPHPRNCLTCPPPPQSRQAIEGTDEKAGSLGCGEASGIQEFSSCGHMTTLCSSPAHAQLRRPYLPLLKAAEALRLLLGQDQRILAALAAWTPGWWQEGHPQAWHMNVKTRHGQPWPARCTCPRPPPASSCLPPPPSHPQQQGPAGLWVVCWGAWGCPQPHSLFPQMKHWEPQPSPGSVGKR